MTWHRAAKWLGVGASAGIALLVLSGCRPGPPPRVFTVDTSADTVDVNPGNGVCRDASGHCSLRAAFQEDNALPVGPMTQIVLTVDVDLSIPRTTDDISTGDLDVTGSAGITGNGHVIDAHGIDRVIHQRSGGLILRDVTIQGGLVSTTGGTGGGIVAEGNLVLIGATVQDNAVIAGDGQGGGIYAGAAAQVVLFESTVEGNGIDGETTLGGGISSEGLLTVVRSTIRANTNDSGSATGGGLYVSGGNARVERSTISGNMSGRAGGAGVGADASLTLSNSTISGNTGRILSTIYSEGTVSLESVTIAENIGLYGIYSSGSMSTSGSIIDDAATACFVPITSGGHNIGSDASCGLTQPSDLQSTDAQLGPLADNGGPTLTHLPAETSPAIDAIATATATLCPASGGSDQRGDHRPIGFGCDVGSVELDTSAPLSLVVDSALDGRDAVPGDRLCDDGAGHCTLRAAVDETNASPFDDTITIAAGIDPTLTIGGANEDGNATGDLDIGGTLTIHGSGATLDAGQLDRAFDDYNGSLAIDDLTITGGLLATGNGAGIRFGGGHELSLQGVTIRDNAATDPSSGQGGGVMTGPGDTVHIADSTVSGNRGAGAGGGVVLWGSGTVSRSTFAGNAGGALLIADGPATIADSTFSSNTSNFVGSAIIAQGPVDLVRSTVVGGAGGPYQQAPVYGASGGSITVRGSIVDQPIFRACFGNVVSAGHNISSDTSCSFTQPTDQAGTVPHLRLLEDNGGPTLTLLPQVGSSAVDAIPAGTAGLCDGSTPPDQRGVARPVSGACDIGAVEGSGPALVPLTYIVDTSLDHGDVAPGDGVCDDGSGDCSLRAAVDESNASPSDDTIEIAVGIDPTLSIAGVDEEANATGDLDVLGRVTIHGGGATLDAASLDRGLHLLAAPVSIDHLTVTHGYAEENGGGIYANGAVTLDHVDLVDNVLWSFDPAGAGIRGFGPTTIVDSTISGNSSIYSSGAFLQGKTTIVRTTVSGNTSTGQGPTLFLEDDVTIDDSTISGNTALSMPGLVIQQGSLVLRNSTISDNVATAPSGSTYASAIDNFFGSAVSIIGSTISATGTEPAILTEGSTFTTIRGSIVTNTGGAACSQAATSGGWNLASDASCGLNQATDHQSVDPLLGLLANNGGPTLTRLPGAGSVAIGAIPVGTVGLCDGTLAHDQRGVTRPQGAACDIGAVEQ